MNARQKAKKYKRELDILKGHVVPFKIESRQGKVETIVSEYWQEVDPALAILPAKMVYAKTVSRLLDDPTFQRAVEFTTMTYPEVHRPGVIKYRAVLKAVMPDDNYSDWEED